MSENPHAILPDEHPNDPLIDLASPNADTRRSAAAALASQPALTAQALTVLEQVAAADSDPTVREAALSALEAPAARRLHTARALPLAVRLEMLEQIERWRVAELLTGQQASAVRLRYTFDLAPRGLSPAAFNGLAGQVEAWQQAGLIWPEQATGLRSSLEQAVQRGSMTRTTPAAQSDPAAPPTHPAPSQSSGQPAPRQSLQQVLFSEISIRIALYLGGFLIVAAALILAAVLEIARLPILLTLTLVCGAAAWLARARLPLPSFVLFIIFASLLPIDAGVISDLLNIERDPANTYWALILAGEAIVLAGGTLLYCSRLFSLAALAALSSAAIFLSMRMGERIEYFLLLLTLTGLISAGWQWLLKRRFEPRFVIPLDWVTHLQTLLVLALTAFTTLLYIAFTYDPSIGETVAVPYRLMIGATWLIALAYYLVSDLLVQRFGALPMLAAGAALFTPWILLSALPVSAAWVAAGVAVIGAAVALGANRLALNEVSDHPLKRYAVPFLMASVGMLAWAAGIGLIENLTTAFFVLLAAGGLFSALHAQKTRLALWLTALLAYLAAYFLFFHLPFARGWQVDLAYQATGAGILLLIPDLLPLRNPRAEVDWLHPARLLGALVITINTLAIGLEWVLNAPVLTGEPASPVDWLTPAWVFGITAVFLLGYALRRQNRLVGYAVTGYLFAALTCWLAAQPQPEFMLPLAALTGGFYLAGLALLLTGRAPGWAQVLRNSGLALSAVIVFFLPIELEEKLRPGLALLLAGMLFLSEIHIRQGSWLELPMDLLLALGGTRLLRLFISGPALPGYDLLAAALIVLGFDLYFTRRRGASAPQRPAQRALGGVLVAACALFWIFAERIPPREPALAFLVLAAFFLLAAWGYRQPRLGYLTVAFTAGSLYYSLRFLGHDTWLAAEIGLAAALYAGSFAIRRWLISPAWFEVLRLSGLGLAMLVSLTAPLEGSGLAASLWVSVAASLYAIETFRLRNVWLGFPTNGLYLLAYFILLIDLKVREPQYFSVGVALLGILMHYLLVRSGSRLGAFFTGLVSQFVLLGTTYIQMVSTDRLSFFVMLFFQGLAVLVYGIIIRSRSLVLAPVAFIVVGVITVVLSVLSGIPTALIIGCTGVLLLALGILALVMRERLVEASGRFGGWRA